MQHARSLALKLAAFLAVIFGSIPAHPADTPPGAAPPVSNMGDTCADAIVIPWSAITSPTGYLDRGATGTSDNVPVTCGADGSDAFYTFTAGADTNLWVTTCGPDTPTDTVLSFKTRVNCATNTAIACADDGCRCEPAGGNTFSSTLPNIAVTAGMQYVLQVDNWASTASAPFTLRVYLSSTMFDLGLYESLDRTSIPLPANLVATPVTSPHFQSPLPQAPVVYYQVDDDHCTATNTLLAVRRGMDAEFTF